MVRVFAEASLQPKSSINFLLNSPNSSVDVVKDGSMQRGSSLSGNTTIDDPATAGLDRLLNAASILSKYDALSGTSHSSSTSVSTGSPLSSKRRASDRHNGAASSSMSSAAGSTPGEVIQKVSKRRRRQNIKCELCDRVFGDSSSARKHHRVVHLKIKEFECEECGKTFAEKSNRSKHYIAAHLNQRSHACPDCDKVFNFTDGLRRHRNNVHLNLRPYPCDECNTSYKQKTHLLKHQQSVHGVPLPPKN